MFILKINIIKWYSSAILFDFVRINLWILVRLNCQYNCFFLKSQENILIKDEAQSVSSYNTESYKNNKRERQSIKLNTTPTPKPPPISKTQPILKKAKKMFVNNKLF